MFNQSVVRLGISLAFSGLLDNHDNHENKLVSGDDDEFTS